MKLFAVITAICLCSASIVSSFEAGTTLLPDPQSLPAAHQPHDRILAVITLADPALRRPDSVSRQLDHYVAACEAGFEVHVVFVTWRADWTSLGYLFEPARNLCTRLMADLPVAVSVHQSDLAARHRDVFSAKAGMYDYYLSQEDDILYKAHHFQYFKHWANALKEAPLMHPGFYMFEVPSQHVPPQSQLTYSPACTHDDWRSDLHLFMWRGHLLAAFRFGYDASYMLTDEQLKKYSSYPAWLGARAVEWTEFNVPFQGQFLANHAYRVVPIAQLNRAMLHHTSDKYINMNIRNSKAKGGAVGRRSHGPDVMSELLLILRKCTGLQVHAPPFITPPYNESTVSIKWDMKLLMKFMAWRSNDKHPCSICLNRGEAVWLELRVASTNESLFHNETNVNDILPSSATIKVECRKAIPKQNSHGCGKMDGDCAAKNTSWWGEPLLDGTTDLEAILGGVN